MSYTGAFNLYFCISFYFVGFVDGFEGASGESVGFLHKLLIMLFWPAYLVVGFLMRLKK